MRVAVFSHFFSFFFASIFSSLQIPLVHVQKIIIAILGPYLGEDDKCTGGIRYITSKVPDRLQCRLFAANKLR